MAQINNPPKLTMKTRPLSLWPIAGGLLSVCTTVGGRLFRIALLVDLGLLDEWLPLLSCKIETRENNYSKNLHFRHDGTSNKHIVTIIKNVYVHSNAGMRHKARMLPVIFCHLSPSFFAISVVASSGLLFLIFCNGKVPVIVQHIPAESAWFANSRPNSNMYVLGFWQPRK